MFFVLLDIFFIFIPQFKQLRAISLKSKEYRIKFNTLNRELTLKSSFLKEREAVKKRIETREARFLRKEDRPLVLSEINRIVKELGLEVLNMKLAEPQKVEELGELTLYYLPVVMELNTDYHSLGKFLNLLERNKIYFFTQELKIKRGPRNNNIELVVCGIVKD